MEKKIISRYHDDVKEGHQGLARTMEKIQRDFYIPGLTRKIKKYIDKCEECQTNKHDNRRPFGKMTIEKETPTRPWQHLAMDFMAMPAEKERKQILVVVDRFSKMTILITLPVEATTEEVFQAVWERVFAIFGIPESIISDLDKIFRSKQWKERMGELKITHKLSTANHQRTDGQSERKIQEIQTYLRIYVKEMKNWEEWIPLLQYVLNDALSAATRETPFFVVFGRNRNENQKIEDMEKRMTAIHSQVLAELRWSTEQMKLYFDKKCEDAPSLEEGDRVYLRRRTKGSKDFNIKSRNSMDKLGKLMLGPFEIKRKLENENYELWLPEGTRIHPVFHISLLKPTNNEVNHDGNPEIYEVEKIINKRKDRKGKEQYEVKWFGFEETTWEPKENLNCPQALEDFEMSTKKSATTPEKKKGIDLRERTQTDQDEPGDAFANRPTTRRSRREARMAI